MQSDILPENHHAILYTQVLLATAYLNLGRPRDGIPWIVDALEKGEKTGLPEWRMRGWRSELVRSSNAIPEPVTPRLL